MIKIFRSYTCYGSLVLASLLALFGQSALGAIAPGTPEAKEALLFDPFNPTAPITQGATSIVSTVIPNSQNVTTLSILSQQETAVTNPNPPPLPTLSVSDSPKIVEHGPNLQAVFTVTLSKASTKTVTVLFTTSDGTAKKGSDYTLTSGTVTFTPGQTSTTVKVHVYDNVDLDEAEFENFFLNLAHPTNATIARPQGTCVIDDDGLVTKTLELKVNDTSTTNSAGAKATFTVTMSNTTQSTIKVHYATADSTAKAGVDYTATSGTVTFFPDETSHTVVVNIVKDNLPNQPSSKKFFLNLSSATSSTAGIGVKIVDSQGVGTINKP